MLELMLGIIIKEILIIDDQVVTKAYKESLILCKNGVFL